MNPENKEQNIQEQNEVQKKNRLLLVLLIGLVVLIGGAYLLYAGLRDQVEQNQLSSQGNTTAENTEEQQEEQLNPAPDFTVFDAEGNEVKLSDFRGKPVVLNFWASWSGPCKSEMPDFNAAYLQHGAKIQFLMVNMTDGYSETQESGQKLIDEQGYAFPVYFDLKQEAAITYGVSSIPTTYFIDADGNFVAYGRGALDAGSLQKGIDMLLKQ